MAIFCPADFSNPQKHCCLLQWLLSKRGSDFEPHYKIKLQSTLYPDCTRKHTWSIHEAHLEQTWSKLRAYVMHVYIEYVCFMFVSSCKRGIRQKHASLGWMQAGVSDVQVELMLKMGVKAEIQCLDAVSHNFLTNVYLPNKLQYGGWI